MLGDAKEIIQKKLTEKAHRILMPLPEKALEYLPYATRGLKNHHGTIHFYDFVHATRRENPVEKVKSRTTEKLRSLGVTNEYDFARIVRTTGPNWHQIVLDIVI